MKKARMKIILSLIITMIFAMLIPINVQAAGSYSLSKGSASITTGGTTTITVTTSGCEGKFSVSSSNTSVATVSTSSFWGDEKGATITVTAKSAGSATITVTPVDVTDTELNDITGSKTCTVTVSDPVQNTTPSTNTGTSNSGSTGNTGASSNKPTNNTSKPSTNTSKPSTNTSKPSTSTNTTTTVKKSSNSKLESLQIAEGAILPEFNSSTVEYSISIPNEITKLNISAVAEDSKATVKISGNEELQIGDNNIEIVVTAEDGSKTTYKILAKRAQPELCMQTLTVAYIDENGEQVELILNPAFTFNIYEYVIDSVIPHTVKNLEIVGTANRENAVIEVLDNDELKTGENVITIKVTVTDEAGLEEQKTYTIKVQKDEKKVVAPLTAMEKLKKWFNGAGTTISAWFSNNSNKIVPGILVFETIIVIGLTIYCIRVYKKSKELLSKLAEYNKSNLMERANIALDPEAVKLEETENNFETVGTTENQEKNIIEEIAEKQGIKTGRGRRFK